MAMIKTILLFTIEAADGNGYTNLPKWWENFIDTMPLYYNTQTPTNKLLKVYHAMTYVKQEGNSMNRYLEFETEEDYVEFVLRWS
jgi:hypothetical protein